MISPKQHRPRSHCAQSLIEFISPEKAKNLKKTTCFSNYKKKVFKNKFLNILLASRMPQINSRSQKAVVFVVASKKQIKFSTTNNLLKGICGVKQKLL